MLTKNYAVKTVKEAEKILNLKPSQIKSLECDLEKIFFDDNHGQTFLKIVEEYANTENCDYEKMLSDMKILSKELDINEFSGALLLLLSMTDILHKRYKERNIGEDIFLNSILDIKYKLTECELVYGVKGVFTFPWLTGFFKFKLFGLGRLQFEIVKMPFSCEFDGVGINLGDTALKIHIPRTGERLNHSEVLNSYRMACEFFKDIFKGKPFVFICSSWLLDPWNMTVLSQNSNLRAFVNDFKIINTGKYDDYKEIWRLFDCLYDGNPDHLSADSSLRRAYIEKIRRNEKTGWGEGVFIIK